MTVTDKPSSTQSDGSTRQLYLKLEKEFQKRFPKSHPGVWLMHHNYVDAIPLMQQALSSGKAVAEWRGPIVDFLR